MGGANAGDDDVRVAVGGERRCPYTSHASSGGDGHH
jgi:hypothetical protein